MLIQQIAQSFLDSQDKLWTFMLLISRFTAFFILIPALGAGPRGLTVRGTLIAFISAICVPASKPAVMPPDYALALAQLTAELLVGTLFSILPRMVISGLELAGQLAGNTMGLGAAQVMDPTSGAQVSPVGALYGQLGTLLFLSLDGANFALQQAVELASKVSPGTFIVDEQSIEVLLIQSGYIFEAGVIFSAPIVLALLLTQFAMGIISKAVTTVNIFIISFPITILAGLSLAILSLGELMQILLRDFEMLEQGILTITAR